MAFEKTPEELLEELWRNMREAGGSILAPNGDNFIRDADMGAQNFAAWVMGKCGSDVALELVDACNSVIAETAVMGINPVVRVHNDCTFETN
jgi:hypothetical protein